MFSFNISGGGAISEQLENRITELIISGRIEPDEKLPAVREVAKQYAVNPNTVQKTYRSLEQRGLISSITGKGSYAAGRESYIDEVKKKAASQFRAAVIAAQVQGLDKDELSAVIAECFGKDE